MLDYCLHVGSENVVLYAKENIYVIKTLKEFQHVDDNGRDVGANGKRSYWVYLVQPLVLETLNILTTFQSATESERYHESTYG